MEKGLPIVPLFYNFLIELLQSFSRKGFLYLALQPPIKKRVLFLQPQLIKHRVIQERTILQRLTNGSLTNINHYITIELLKPAVKDHSVLWCMLL